MAEYDQSIAALDRNIERARADAERARHARELMDDPLMVEAFALLEQRWTEAWTTSRREDSAKREEAYKALAAVLDLKSYFQTVLEAGENANTLIESFGRERESLMRRAMRVVGL